MKDKVTTEAEGGTLEPSKFDADTNELDIPLGEGEETHGEINQQSDMDTEPDRENVDNGSSSLIGNEKPASHLDSGLAIDA